MLQRVKEVQESDLRMDGALARNIQRVIAVTQADIDAAAAQGKAWVVKPVVKVSDPLDNLRGGTQLVIKQNSILPGQNVMRVMYIGGQAVVVGPGTSPLPLPDATDNDILSLIAFGGTEQRNLPDDYIERQFIYMMDGSYLAVTNQSITSDYKIEFDFATTNLSSSLGNYFGARASGVAAGGGFRVTKLSNQGVAMYGFDTTDAYESGANIMAANTRYKYVYENGTCKLSSGGTDVLTHTYTVNDTSTITAFGVNAYTSNGTTYSASGLGIYCYGLKIWNGQGELVMNLVPAVQKGTVPVVGFYDTVSGTFKTATSGTFAAGGEAVPTPDTPMDIISNNGVLKARHQSGLPLGYTLLDYVETDGNSYIDTNLLLSNTSEFEITFQSADATLNTPVMGAISGGTSFTSTDNLCVTYTVASGLNAYSVYCNGAAGDANESWNAGDARDKLKHTVKYNGLNIAPTLDGVDMEQLVPTTLIANTPTVTTWLFGRNNTGSGTKTQTGVRIYDFKVGGVAHFVPCKNASNVIGMYDTVNGVFYQNTGTGTFVAGPAVSDPVEIYTDGLQETITIKDDQSATISTAVAEMLLKVSSDYQDQQEIIDGTVTRKVGVTILKGTEVWNKSSTYTGSFYTNSFSPDGGPKVANNPTDIVLTHGFVVADLTAYSTAGIGAFYWYSPSTVNYKYDDGTATVAQFKQWLADQYAAGTPIIVAYPLATPTTESVTAQPMQTVEGDNTAEITQASLNNLELQVEYIGA